MVKINEEHYWVAGTSLATSSGAAAVPRHEHRLLGDKGRMGIANSSCLPKILVEEPERSRHLTRVAKQRSLSSMLREEKHCDDGRRVVTAVLGLWAAEHGETVGAGSDNEPSKPPRPVPRR